MTRAGKKEVGRRMMRTRICDLPPEVIGENIITRVPISSLTAVRSTCKLWKDLTNDWVLGKASTARNLFLGFMTMDSKVCSLRFHLCRSKDKEKEEDFIDLSIKQVDLLNQVKISKLYHCDGLFLCVAKDNSRLVVWNPYLGQTRWIRPRTDFHWLDSYALGYDINRNHKILRFLDYYGVPVHRHEIYDFSSNSWRVLEITPDWEIASYQSGVSLKGNTYFYARERIGPDFSGVENGDLMIYGNEIKDFLLCFDFTREMFGPRLPLPFHSWSKVDTVSLSCVREEQLAVLYQVVGVYYNSCDIVQIWVTTRIEPKNVSWSKFLNVEMRPFAFTGVRFKNYTGGSTFFIDEEEKLAVVFAIDGDLVSPRYDTAFIIGEDGYFKSVSLGVVTESYRPPLVCSSSYLPSLVQLNQPR